MTEINWDKLKGQTQDLTDDDKRDVEHMVDNFDIPVATAVQLVREASSEVRQRKRLIAQAWLYTKKGLA